jgi:acetoin utilization protein AcuB
MLVRNWMAKKVVTIDLEDTMQHAVKLIKDHKINMLPVLDHGKVVGVLSKIDLKRAHATLLEVHELAKVISNVKVREIMTKDPITVAPDFTIEETAELMMAKNIAGLPVVDEKGRLVGIITQRDLFHVLISLSGLGRRGVQFAFRVEDRPGCLKELTDTLSDFGGRIASIMSTYEGLPEGFRKVYIRAYNLDREKLPQLFQELMSKATMLYFVDRRESRREIFQP